MRPLGRCELPVPDQACAAPGRAAEHAAQSVTDEACPPGSEPAHALEPPVVSGEFQLLQRFQAQLAMDALGQLLTDAGVVSSGKQVKDALGRQAVFVNGRALGSEDNSRPADCFTAEQALFGRFFLLKLGKKKHHLFDLGKD